MPAATSAPKTTMRMMSVTGMDSSPAFLRSSRKAASISFSPLTPKEPMNTSGLAAFASPTAAMTGSIFVRASSGSPVISKSMSAACPAWPTWPAFSGSSGDWTSVTTSTAETLVITSSTAAVNAGSLTVSVSLWMSTLSPAGCTNSSWRSLSIRPDSPTPEVACSILVVPLTMPRAKATTTKPSQPKIAVLRCCALHRPIRPARLVDGLPSSGGEVDGWEADASGSF